MRRLLPVALFAFAFACAEAAVVIYLRRLVGVVEPWLDPGIFDPTIALIEVVREAATLVILAAVGWACGRNAQTRVAFFGVAFGLWDIFYYAWLKLFLGWPASILTPDILFLIPLPWWGPVLTPVLIALLFVAAGIAAIALDDRGRAVRIGAMDGLLGVFGILAILYAFMADAIAVLPATAETLSGVRPTAFRWGIYSVGLALMAIGTARSLVAASGARVGADARDPVRGTSPRS